VQPLSPCEASSSSSSSSSSDSRYATLSGARVPFHCVLIKITELFDWVWSMKLIFSWSLILQHFPHTFLWVCRGAIRQEEAEQSQQVLQVGAENLQPLKTNSHMDVLQRPAGHWLELPPPPPPANQLSIHSLYTLYTHTLHTHSLHTHSLHSLHPPSHGGVTGEWQASLLDLAGAGGRKPQGNPHRWTAQATFAARGRQRWTVSNSP